MCIDNRGKLQPEPFIQKQQYVRYHRISVTYPRSTKHTEKLFSVRNTRHALQFPALRKHVTASTLLTLSVPHIYRLTISMHVRVHAYSKIISSPKTT